jgi:N-acetylmuramoyl-L-alanine amidase
MALKHFACEIRFPGILALKNGRVAPPASNGACKRYDVKQGDTLFQIAKTHGLDGAHSLYAHPENAGFRQLRPDPNLIFPGDVLYIPPPASEPFREAINTEHTFVMQQEREQLRIRVLAAAGKPIENRKLVLTVAGQSVTREAHETEALNLPLDSTSAGKGTLTVYDNNDAGVPIETIELVMAHLDPVDTVSGQQARLNSLNFEAGQVDGIMGEKTRAALVEFQTENDLQTDGLAGPQTQNKLVEIYGC